MIRQKQLLIHIDQHWYRYLNHRCAKKHRQLLVVACQQLIRDYSRLIAKQFSMKDHEDELMSKAQVLTIEIIDQRRTGKLIPGRTFGTFLRFKLYRSMKNWALAEKKRRIKTNNDRPKRVGSLSYMHDFSAVEDE